jgi:2-polyprenyl-6-methoxyphenol hydroxylase and related FAD-dependent oxidoreductases
MWYDRAMKAIIVGAGIGGLTAAIAMRRDDVEAVVFERANDVQAVQLGGGIHLWHNGMRGLQQVGIAEQVQALGGHDAVVERAEFSTAKGKLLANWPIAALEREVGAPTIGIVRPDLHRVLIGALEPSALRLGSSCIGFEERNGSVLVRFEDGHEEQGDILVGADGLRSAIRRQLHGVEEPHFAQYASWQAFADIESDETPPGLFRVIFGRGARFLHYRVGPRRIYWEGIFATTAGGRDPEGGRKQAALERFAGWRAPVEAIIEATDEQAINRADIYDRPPIKTWGVGRVTLLGDAAHPMTNALGQGANQAIEDAIVLAHCLRRASDPVAAVRDYERRRIGRTAKIAKLSAFMTALSRWQRPWAVAFRNRWLRLSLGSFVFKGLKRDMSYDF